MCRNSNFVLLFCLWKPFSKTAEIYYTAHIQAGLPRWMKIHIPFYCFHYLVQIFAWLFDEFSGFSSSVDISSSITSSLNPFLFFLFPISSYLKFTEFLFLHKIKILNFLFLNTYDRPASKVCSYSVTHSVFV